MNTLQSVSTVLANQTTGIDHIAIAVIDLEAAIDWYVSVLGFTVTERRETGGRFSGMVSAVLKAGPLTFVLVQGTSPESQVSRFIEHFGPGIQHVALGVQDLPGVVEQLRQNGLEFATTVIRGPGLQQIFSHRDPQSGLMFELIERMGAGGFTDQTVNELFEQLESHDLF